MRILLVLTLLPLLLGCEPGPASDANPAEGPPNIVFIMADDLGYGDLGTYGQEMIRTPHLDRMAAGGLRFTQFYAGSTVCAPSRAVLMTGLHTGHVHVRNNVGWQPRGDVPLRSEDVTIAEVLKEAGYTTGAFGKWALGLKDTPGAPSRQGFDAFFGYEDQSEAHHYHVATLQQIEDGEVVDVEVDSLAYSHDLIMNEAFEFVRRHRDEPFFLYLPVTIPHADLVVPEASLQEYLDEEGRSLLPEAGSEIGRSSPQDTPAAAYAAMISHLDRDVGRLIDLLEELGLDGNTIVFFTSDNGPHAEGGHDPEVTDSNGPLRGIKRDLYEGGIRVPMIAWGPGRIPSGEVSDHVWAAWDVLPTVAELAGRPAPTDIDGISMAGALTGTGPADHHSSLYWEFYPGGKTEFRQAVRAGDWKMLRFRYPDRPSRVELYDLDRDPGETNDLSKSHPETAARLVQAADSLRWPPQLEDFVISWLD